MSLSDFFEPKWKHSDPNVRKDEIEKITDQDILRAVVENDNNSGVRKAAVKKVTQQRTLFHCAIYDKANDVRIAAVESITDQKIIVRLAKSAFQDNIVVQLAAIEKVTDPGVLSIIAQNDENSDVRKAAVKKQKALVDIGKAMLESSEKIFVLNMDVPVIKDKGEFSRIVQNKGIPIGLLVNMDEFADTYGELRSSVPHPEMGGFNPFHVSAKKGPCRLFCPGYKNLLSDSFIFGLSSASAFRGGVGGRNLQEGLAGACPSCGGKNAVIVFNPMKTE